MIVFDVETSGLDPFSHTMLSIGAYDTSSNREFYSEIQCPSWADISTKALKVNGFTEDEIYGKHRTPLQQAVQEFLDWSGYAEIPMLAGWNVHFDVAFMKSAFSRYNIKWPFGFRVVDVHSVVFFDIMTKSPNDFYRYLTVTGMSKISLNKALVYYGLPPEPNPHNALTGAKASAVILLSLRERNRKVLLDHI